MKRLPEELEHRLQSLSDSLTDIDLGINIGTAARLTGIPRATLYYYFSGKSDLVAFFPHHKLGAIAKQVAKAHAGEGFVPDRLSDALTQILHSVAEHPSVFAEIPLLLRESSESTQSTASVEAQLLGPLRLLLEEGVAGGELNIPDPNTASIALLGAIAMVGLMQISTTGRLDAEATARDLVPQLLYGLSPRLS